MNNLTPKQQRFCEEYAVDLNATQAAIRAGYSSKTARSIGQENLTKPDIQNYIQNVQGALKDKTLVTAEEVIAGIKRISEKAEQSNQYIAALRAFELLGKHLGIFVDKQVNANIDLNELYGQIKQDMNVRTL